MERYFQKLFGLPTNLGVDVALLRPEAGEVAPGDFEYPAWGRFAIWVGGKNLSASVSSLGEYALEIEWDVGSILEWLVENWDAIFYEEALPGEDLGPTGAASLEELASRAESGALSAQTELLLHKARYEWRARHSLEAARDGGLLPNVVLRRNLDDLEVSWDSRRAIEGAERSFVEQSGSCLVDLWEAHRALCEFVTETSQRLLVEHPDLEEITSLHKRMDQTLSPPNNEQRILRLAGLHPQRTIAEEGAELSLPTPAELELIREDEPAIRDGILLHSAVTMLFRSLSPEVTQEDVRAIKNVLHESVNAEAALDSFRTMVRKVRVEVERPAWQQAYELAADFRDSLALPPASPLESDAVLDELGVKRAEVALSDRNLRALCFRSDKYPPCIALNSNSSYFQTLHAREFDLAHELCHLLHDQEFGRPLGVVSGPWAPQYLEQRANAFAAYARLPKEAIGETLGREAPSEVSPSEVRTLMSRYKVGATMATWQLKNLGWITEYERVFLLDVLGVPQLAQKRDRSS